MQPFPISTRLYQYTILFFLATITINGIATEISSNTLGVHYWIAVTLSVFQLLCFWRKYDSLGLVFFVCSSLLEILTNTTTIVGFIAYIYGITVLTYRSHYKSFLVICVLFFINGFITTDKFNSFEYTTTVLSNLFISITFATVGVYLNKLSLIRLKSSISNISLDKIMLAGLLGPFFTDLRRTITLIDCLNIKSSNGETSEVTKATSNISNEINRFEPLISLKNLHNPEPEELLLDLKTSLKNLGYYVVLNNKMNTAITVATEQLIWCAIIGHEVTQFLDKSKGIKLKLDLTESEVSRKLVLRYKAKAATKSTVNNENIDYLLESYLDYFKIIREVDHSLDNQIIVTVTVPKSFS